MIKGNGLGLKFDPNKYRGSRGIAAPLGMSAHPIISGIA